MHFNFLASRCPEYSELRARNKPLAMVWRLGHGILCMCLLALPGAIAVWCISRDDPEHSAEVALAFVAPVLLIAATGVIVKRYAVKKGAA